MLLIAAGHGVVHYPRLWFLSPSFYIPFLSLILLFLSQIIPKESLQDGRKLHLNYQKNVKIHMMRDPLANEELIPYSP
jgi:hypothetical protein